MSPLSTLKASGKRFHLDFAPDKRRVGVQESGSVGNSLYDPSAQESRWQFEIALGATHVGDVAIENRESFSFSAAHCCSFCLSKNGCLVVSVQRQAFGGSCFDARPIRS